MSFRSPQRSGDVQQNLVLKFVDNALPPLQYRIRARVRSPLEVAPERIVVTGLPKGSQQVERIQIKKYGQGKWADCHLQTAVPWIRPLSVYELPTPNPSPESPTQLFQASLAIETALLNPGTHTAFVEVHLSEASEDSEVLQLPVRVSVTGKAVAVPETLFFGRVHEATAASARVEVVLQGESHPKLQLSMPTVTIGSPELVTVRLREVSGGFRSLELTLTPNGSEDSIIRSAVGLEYPELPGEVVRIEVLAKVAE